MSLLRHTKGKKHGNEYPTTRRPYEKTVRDDSKFLFSVRSEVVFVRYYRRTVHGVRKGGDLRVWRKTFIKDSKSNTGSDISKYMNR